MNKLTKRFLYAGLSLPLLLVLSGCVKTNKAGQPTGEGWVYNLLVKPMSSAVEFFATPQHLGLGFGLAIIIVTVIVRLIILPLGLRQAYTSSYMQEKMAYLKPVFEPLQNRVNNANTQEEKLQAQTELMQAQKDNGINMLSSMGCLPLLIQMPFFTALFYAAKFTDGISTATFLGIDLGHSNLVLTALAGFFYLGQSWLATFGVDEAQRKQMMTMMWMSPIMIIIFSLSAPAGVTLYWVVGGVFGIIQQAIITFIIKPHLRRRIDAEFEANPPVLNGQQVKDVTESAKKDELNSPIIVPKSSGRNAGKQNR